MSGAATLYADAGQLAVTFARAGVGESLVYAHGAALDSAHPTVRLVRTWQDEGRARCHAMGRDDQGRQRQVVVKRAAAPAMAEARPAGRAGDLALRIDAAIDNPRTAREAKAVLEQVRAVAARGQVMPSSAELAEALGLKDRKRSDYLLRRLCQAGIIEIWSVDRGPRVVRIVGTGIETANVYAEGAARPGLAGEIKRVFG